MYGEIKVFALFHSKNRRLRVAHRVARGCYQPPAPSEPCVRLSPHTAQASKKAVSGGATRPAQRFLRTTLRYRHAAITLQQGEGAPSLPRRHLRSFLKTVSHVFSQMDTRRTSALFRAGQSLNPYLRHYSAAFAFSDLSIPQLQQCALRFTCLAMGRRYEVSTFHIHDNAE